RYSTSTPKVFLKASGTFVRASGLGPVASTSLPSFLAPATQLSHVFCQSASAAPLLPAAALAGLAAREAAPGLACPQAASAKARRPAAVAARNARLVNVWSAIARCASSLISTPIVVSLSPTGFVGRYDGPPRWRRQRSPRTGRSLRVRDTI